MKNPLSPIFNKSSVNIRQIADSIDAVVRALDFEIEVARNAKNWGLVGSLNGIRESITMAELAPRAAELADILEGEGP